MKYAFEYVHHRVQEMRMNNRRPRRNIERR